MHNNIHNIENINFFTVIFVYFDKVKNDGNPKSSPTRSVLRCDTAIIKMLSSMSIRNLTTKRVVNPVRWGLSPINKGNNNHSPYSPKKGPKGQSNFTKQGPWDSARGKLEGNRTLTPGGSFNTKGKRTTILKKHSIYKKEVRKMLY